MPAIPAYIIEARSDYGHKQAASQHHHKTVKCQKERQDNDGPDKVAFPAGPHPE
ncbi:hypothetical protein ACFOWX_08770 [Sphingorhabdus arenilitoris]|uniref:Uncharacterized protein n=1 Tax=Sphingorhabdus arenilitoris TaxID=1490041 RepID=A0ABV8RI02_9SPHN